MIAIIYEPRSGGHGRMSYVGWAALAWRPGSKPSCRRETGPAAVGGSLRRRSSPNPVPGLPRRTARQWLATPVANRTSSAREASASIRPSRSLMLERDGSSPLAGQDRPGAVGRVGNGSDLVVVYSRPVPTICSSAPFRMPLGRSRRHEERRDVRLRDVASDRAVAARRHRPDGRTDRRRPHDTGVPERRPGRRAESSLTFESDRRSTQSKVARSTGRAEPAPVVRRGHSGLPSVRGDR